MDKQEKKIVIIIGAGVAGITAGVELMRFNHQSSKANDNHIQYDVTILEESEYIGGIARTINYHNNRMDIGGHRFFSKDQRVIKWWESILPTQGKPSYDDIMLDRVCELKEDGPDPEQEDKVMLRRKRISRIFYKHNFFDYPIKINFSTIKNLGFITTIKAGFSYIKASCFKKVENSLENFYINRFGKKLYSIFFEDYTEKVWGRHPRAISADWGRQRIKGLSIRTILKNIFSKIFPKKKANMTVETSLIEEFSYPKYGPGQLWETAAEEFVSLGGKILTKSKVTGVVQSQQTHIQSVTYINENASHTCDVDYLFSSMPLKDFISAMNEVPQKLKSIAQGLPYRDFVTIGLLASKIKIKNMTKEKTLNHCVPDCWIYIQDTNVKLGRIQIFNNWSPYLVAKPDETTWIGLEYFCNEGDEYWNRSDAEWAQLGFDELVRIGMIDQDEEILDTHCEKVKKAYPAYFDTYTEIDTLKHYLNEFDNLYCIGRNGQHRYNNMDHSMVTAFEAVNHLTGKIEDKSSIWNVNMENGYQETI